ncbi:hypothetical protein CPB86DRAFT_789686 [Serendipita vermifera]|nr:hypothetical protein CPB86DRAFT_789686 [Serendipita vermifera]
MSGWLNKLTTKDGKLAPAPNGKPTKPGSRSITPSPSLPKITLPPTEVATPKVVLTQDDDSVSPMTVSPTSVHRMNSMSASQDSLGRYSTNEGHRRYATVANDNIPVRQRHQSEIPRASTPKTGRSRSNSAADAAANASIPITESPTQSIGSRRSGSIASGESTQFQSLAQLVDSPPQIGQRVSLPAATNGALSDKEKDGMGSPGKKRRTTGRQHASSVGAASANSRGKPATRHQTTMGMGLASALVASGMGIAPPPNMLSSPAGSLSPPALSKKPSNLSAANVSPNDPSSPERTRIVRPRVRSASSNSKANYDSAEDSEDYDSGDALSFNDDEIPITGFAVATMKRNQDFHEMFPQVPPDDYLIDDYGCALQRDILIQGRLYVSENHLCFHANIFGWVTDVIIPVSNVTAVEKKMTAFVIPNAIGITEHGTTKHTFASFLARDNVYDVIYSVWRNGAPSRSAATSPGSDTTPGINGRDGVFSQVEPGSARARKATQCACSKAGAHYTNIAMDSVVPGTPEQIYNLMFASGFIKDFLSQDQKLIDIQTSDWQPSPENQHLLSRNMSYIKPLSGGFGPKQTKCELRDENQHIDFNDYASTITTTRTPDVPSGGVFAVKTRTCIMWAGATTSKVVVTFTVEWTGKSFIKGIIEKSCGDGQKTYYAELEAAMRKYISEHRTEFLPEGVDAAAADQEAEEEGMLSPTTPKEPSTLQPTGPKPVATSRGLQWALDTFEAASKVATDSLSGLFDIISDLVGGLSFSRTTVLGFVILLLVISNIYTIMTSGQRRETGRRHAAERKENERERWVGDAVRAFMEVQQSLYGIPTPAIPSAAATALPTSSSANQASVSQVDLKAELQELRDLVGALEERLNRVKSRLDELD